MKFFDAFIEAGFKTLDNGTILFYPLGIFGKGYILPSTEKKTQIENELKRKNSVILPFAGLFFAIYITSLMGHWWYGLIPSLFILLAITVYSIKSNDHLTRGLAVTPVKISASEIYKRAAKSWPTPLLWCLEIGSVLFVLAGVLILLSGRSILVGLAGIGIFGLCSLIYGYMLYAKRK